MAHTTLAHLNERTGFNWLMITRWDQPGTEKPLEIYFADGGPPMQIPKGPEAEAVLAYLKQASEPVTRAATAVADPEAAEVNPFSRRFGGGE